jgi:PKD repeat protein
MVAGTVRQFCIAGLFSLLFLLATSTYALAVDCTICHYPGGIGPLPHNAGCTDTSCALTCHPSQDVNMHPTSVYTPWGAGTADRTTICRTCHDKPWPDVYHPFKINVSAGSITPPGSVDLDQACGQCHGGGTNQATSPPKKTPDGLHDYPYYNKTTLGAFATSIHVYKPMPTASFTAAHDPVTSYKVNFDASASTCPAEVAPCTYDWDFTNDGTNDASGITATNTYGGTATQTVKLTVTDNISRTATTTRSVTPQLVNNPPVAAFTTNTASLPTVTVTNTSTDENVASVKFYLTWGDGSAEPIRTGLSNPTFTHTYTAAGTFTITLLATDAGGLSSNFTSPVTVTIAKYTIGGTVTAGPAGASNVNSVLLTLKKGTTVVANTYTAASGSGPFTYSFPNLAAGVYTVTATKTAAVFAQANPTAAITVGPDSLGNNFTTVKTKFKITSTAKGSGGANLSGVTITVKNTATNALVAQGTTNASGVYETAVTLPASPSYTVTAAKTGRVFSVNPQFIGFANGEPDGSLTFNSTTP